MAGVGSLTLARLWGQMPTESLNTDLLAEAGVDGFGLRTRELRARPTTYVGWNYYSTSSDAYAAFVTAQALRGTFVTLTDEFGQTFANTAVLDVRVPGFMALLGGPNPRTVYKDGATKTLAYFEFDVMVQNA